MKKAFYILFILALTSCGTRIAPEKGDWAGYIFFDGEACTKSNLVEGQMTGLGYSVVAFEYPNTTSWSVFKETGTPASSRFPWPTAVNASGRYDATETNDGSQLVPWDNGSRYSFFGIYPSTSDASIDMKSGTTRNTAGVPVVTYTNPSSSDPSAFSGIVFQDVMRASQKDITSSVDGGTVRFTFRHVLSCLTFEARNFDDVSDASDHSKDQSVSGLTVYFTSPLYRQLDIPLDENVDIVPYSPVAGTKQYLVQEGTVEVPALVHGENLVSVPVAPDNNILLIPQRADGENGHLTGYISFTDKAGVKKIGLQGVPGYEYDSHLSFDSDKDFEPGKKYALMINFTNGMISIAIIESGDWIDSDQNITFE